MNTWLRDLLPPKVRQAIYGVLGTAVAIEAIIDVVPANVENKTLAVLTVLGFGVAFSNVKPNAPKEN